MMYLLIGIIAVKVSMPIWFWVMYIIGLLLYVFAD